VAVLRVKLLMVSFLKTSYIRQNISPLCFLASIYKTTFLKHDNYIGIGCILEKMPATASIPNSK
jgi:hypothetical protein